MKTAWILGLALLMGLAPIVRAQPDPDFEREALFPSYSAFKASLEAVVASGDTAALDAFWQALKDARQVPFVRGDSVTFLYRGAAQSVAWNGDFNGWSGDTSVASEGTRLSGGDVWILEHTFPSDGRIDYKIVLNGSQWILDPDNPMQQWSGFGPNSALWMPDYVYPRESIPRPDVLHSTLSDNVAIRSTHLGYDVHYRVYTPADYDALSDLPVLYVTDGHEYADERLGGTTIVLDNLIADGLIPPIMAVFVDPREPGNPDNNRRGSHYANDYEDFAAFLTDELVPAIDSVYKTDPAPEQRGILGTSLGGIFSAYLGAAKPDVFRCIAIHSPAFFYDTRNRKDKVYRMYAGADRLPLRIFMSNGTFSDFAEGTYRMRAVFEDKGYPLRYVEVHEGHSWGNWRALIDDPLVFFWGEGKD